MTTSTTSSNWAAQVRDTRTRMLFSHVPLAAPISGGFAWLIVALIYHLHPSAITPWTLVWASVTFLLECGHGLHAFRFLKSRNRQSPHWRNRQLLFLAGVGSCWAVAGQPASGSFPCMTTTSCGPR